MMRRVCLVILSGTHRDVWWYNYPGDDLVIIQPPGNITTTMEFGHAVWKHESSIHGTSPLLYSNTSVKSSFLTQLSPRSCFACHREARTPHDDV